MSNFIVRFVILAILLGTAFSFYYAAKVSRRFIQNTAVKANLIDTISSSGKFKTLAQAIDKAGMTKALGGNGPFTIFAPNDDAFARLPPGNLDSLMSDIQNLRNLILFHIVPAKMSPTRNGKNWNTLHIDGDGFPKQLTVKVKNWSNTKVHDTYIVTGQEPIPQVVTFDMQADNGLLHEIDAVLIPYQDKMPPKISHIGIGDLYGNRTIQAGYYGSLAGTDRFGKMYDGPEREYKPISVGDVWEYAGNWETRIPDKIYKDAALYQEKKKSYFPVKNYSKQGPATVASPLAPPPVPAAPVEPVVVVRSGAREDSVLSVTGKTQCMQKELDKNGRCPGEAGYVSFAKEAPADFAAFKAEMAARKAAAALKKGK